MHNVDDLITWLRKQAHAAQNVAEKAGDEKPGELMRKRAGNLFAAADMLEAARAGLDPGAGAGPGTRAVGAALAPGTRVRLTLACNPPPLIGLKGVMRGMSRYEFFFDTDEGRQLIVAKHAVLYWELLEEAEIELEEAKR